MPDPRLGTRGLPLRGGGGGGSMEPPKNWVMGFDRGIVTLGARRKVLSTVAYRTNVHDACMSATCCVNDTMYVAPPRMCIDAGMQLPL